MPIAHPRWGEEYTRLNTHKKWVTGFTVVPCGTWGLEGVGVDTVFEFVSNDPEGTEHGEVIGVAPELVLEFITGVLGDGDDSGDVAEFGFKEEIAKEGNDVLVRLRGVDWGDGHSGVSWYGEP